MPLTLSDRGLIDFKEKPCYSFQPEQLQHATRLVLKREAVLFPHRQDVCSDRCTGHA